MKSSAVLDDVLVTLIDDEENVLLSSDVPPIPPSIYFAGCAYGACFCKFSSSSFSSQC